MSICNLRLSRNSAFGKCRIVPVVLLLCCALNTHALTRWSAVQFVPHADMLEGGSFTLNARGYYYSDIVDATTVLPMGSVDLGVTEWVNIEAGYTGGFNLGIKARILGETRPWMPSLAIGMHNIFTHREAYLFDRLSDSLSNELYFVFGKNVEPIRLRFHFGMQMIPGNQEEMVNPYFVLEKYFGFNLYVTAEVHRRAKKMHPSLFASWRFWKRRFEVSAGVVDITGMFIKHDIPPNSPFFASSNSAFVRPGIWFGLRFKGGLKFGKTDGLHGVENSLYSHANSIKEMRGEIDSLKQLLTSSSSRLESMNRSLTGLTDSMVTDEARLNEIAVDRLAILNTLYNAEPFEPEAVNKAMAELIANRDRMLPALYDIVFDPVQETALRSLAITALGEIGTQAAADVIIEILGKSPNPQMAIECLIALGKMKETRAVYLIQQLSNDPNDDVAFTASEVLQKLEKETGVSVTPIPAAMLVPESIPENKIGSGQTYEQEKRAAPQPASVGTPRLKEPIAPEAADSSMVKLEQAQFLEATVSEKSVANTAPAPELSISPQQETKKEITVPESSKPGAKSPENVAGKKTPAGDTPATPLTTDTGTSSVSAGATSDTVKAPNIATNSNKPSPEPVVNNDAQPEKKKESTKKKEEKDTKVKATKKRPPRKKRPKIDITKDSW